MERKVASFPLGQMPGDLPEGFAMIATLKVPDQALAALVVLRRTYAAWHYNRLLDRTRYGGVSEL